MNVLFIYSLAGLVWTLSFALLFLFCTLSCLKNPSNGRLWAQKGHRFRTHQVDLAQWFPVRSDGWLSDWCVPALRVSTEKPSDRNTVNPIWEGGFSVWGLLRCQPLGRSGGSGKQRSWGKGGRQGMGSLEAPSRSHAHTDALDDLKDGWEQPKVSVKSQILVLQQ